MMTTALFVHVHLQGVLRGYSDIFAIRISGVPDHVHVSKGVVQRKQKPPDTNMPLKYMYGYSCCILKLLSPTDSIPQLIAHLGYNFHLRLELMALTTSKRMMHLVEEDVLVAINCIDCLAARLGVMDDGGITVDVWQVAKQMVMEHVSSRGTSSEVAVLREILKDVAVRISVELSIRISNDLIHILLFTNSVELTARVANHGEMLRPDDARRYLNNFGLMPAGFVSDKFVASYKSMEALMLLSIERELTRDEIEEVYKLAVWQSRYFIYHVRPDVVPPHSVESVFSQGARFDPFLLETMLASVRGSDHRPRPVAVPPFPSQGPLSSQVPSDSDEEKEKQDMNEKEKEKIDDDCETDGTKQEESIIALTSQPTLSGAQPVCTSKADTQLVCLFEDARNQDGSSNLISMLRGKIQSAQSSDALQSVELDIKRMVERSTLRNSELRSNLRDLNDAMASSSSSVVATSLRQGIEDTTRELEVESGLVVALGKLQDALMSKRQSFSVGQSSTSVDHLSLVHLKRCLQSVLSFSQQRELDVGVELIVRSLPWFCCDEVASLQAGLGMTAWSLNSFNRWCDRIEEIRHQCCELIDRYRTRQGQC